MEREHATEPTEPALEDADTPDPNGPARDYDVRASLNLSVRGLGRSATVAINELSNRLIAEGRTIYKLGLGQSPFPVPTSVVQALRDNAHQKDYLESTGLKQLRQAIAEFHRRADGVPVDPDMVLVGPGSKELMFLLQVAFYGDLVLPTPCWVSYVPQAQIVGHRVSLVRTTFEAGWRLDATKLDRLCRADPGRPRMIVLNYPGNPDGQTYDATELQRIARVAKHYGLILLSDEIYGKLHHRGEHVSVARFYPEGTIISSGLSKWCGAGGWRLGTFAFPGRLRWLLEAMASVASETFTSTSAPIQYAAVRAFAMGPDLELYLRHVRRLLSHLGLWCARRLRDAGVRVLDPEGAFYLFPDFTPHAAALEAHGIVSAAELCRRALEETGVAFLPGEAFGQEPDDLTARIAYVDFDGAAALEASQAVPLDEPLPEAFLHEHCGRTTRAVSALCDWIGRLAG
jgi:aspartate aminotransferase